MNVDQLEVVAEKLAREPRPCAGCGALAADCLVPTEDGSIAACWICAHDYCEHDRPFGHGPGAHCGCDAEAIYPRSVLAARATRAPSKKQSA